MVYKSTLSPELLEVAKKELHEDPDRRDADIEHIRTWLKKQPHITARTGDKDILLFLRGCKFSLEKTKKKLDTYYTCKSLIPEWYLNRDPQDKGMREILLRGQLFPLNGYDHLNRKVVIVRPNLHDPTKTQMDDIFKATHLISDILMDEDEQTAITGVVQVIDLTGSTAGHMFQMTPHIVKKAMTLWQDAYPLRPKGIHYINTPATFETVFSIFRSFMKEKMRKRVQIHGNDMESFRNAIGKDVLPKDYGGNNGTIQEITDYWVGRCDARRDWLLDDSKYLVDESKRPGKPKTKSDLFGIEGSFRKLNLD